MNTEWELKRKEMTEKMESRKKEMEERMTQLRMDSESRKKEMDDKIAKIRAQDEDRRNKMVAKQTEVIGRIPQGKGSEFCQKCHKLVYTVVVDGDKRKIMQGEKCVVTTKNGSKLNINLKCPDGHVNKVELGA
jgi:hypothetical protein